MSQKRSIVALFVAVALATSAFSHSAPQTRALTFSRVLRIDGVKEDLVPVGDVRIGPRGQIIVPQQQDRKYLVYDSLGRRVATIGRAGEGPGEFKQVGTYFGWKGDSIWTWDANHERFTVFTASGTYVRGLATPQTADLARDRPAAPKGVAGGYVIAPLAGGLFLARGNTPARATEAAKRSRPGICVVVMDSLKQVRSVAVNIPEDTRGISQTTVGSNGATATFGTVVPFTHSTEWETSADGEIIAIVTTTGVARGENTFRVIALRPSGDTVFSIRQPFTAAAIARRTADSAISAGIARLRSGGRAPAGVIREYEARGRGMIPDVYQPYVRHVVGRDHSVWINVRSAANEYRWLGLDSMGRTIGTLVVPRNLRLVEFDGLNAWGLESDSDGVQSVLRLRISG